jgi:thioredoxin 1
MTNLFASFPSTCCQGRNGSDLVPLLVVAAAWVVAHFAGKWLKKSKGTQNMKNLVIVAVLIIAVGVVVVAKQRQGKAVVPAEPPQENTAVKAAAKQPAALPRLVDLGADKCIPCKAMAPILEELKKTYAGQLQVDFIDVWKNPGAGQEYGIRVIPTQIFFSADGRELYRHEGYFSKEDILKKCEEFGFNLK